MKSINDRISAKAIEQRIPLSGTFELSPLCNLKCRMCYVRMEQSEVCAQGGLRPIGWWLKLAEQCRDAGMMNLLLTGGEPFLYPQFRELPEAVSRMGMQVSINTNGTMIDERVIEWLVQSPPSRINITLYGGSRETYGRLCGNPDAFDRVMHACDLLTKAKLRFRFNCSLTPYNAEDLEAILDLAKGYGRGVKVTAYMFPDIRRSGRPGENDGRLTPEQAAYYEVKTNRAQSSDLWFRRTARNAMRYVEQTEEQLAKAAAGPPGEMRCLSGRCCFWVDWQGNLSGCGVNNYPRLSLDEVPFPEAWKRLVEYTNTFLYSSACNNCVNKRVCASCAAMVYNETGGYDGRPVYLCEKAKYAAKWYRIFLDRMPQSSDEISTEEIEHACPIDEF